MKFVLFVALLNELPNHLVPKDVDLVYTGVGKVNAAIITAQYLKDLDPKQTKVINFGSAGSSLPKMNLYRCTKFSQHDMNAEPLAPKHHTPFDELFYSDSSAILTFSDYGHECVTQDKFETQPEPGFIYDMEAYSIAKICKKQGFDFYCFKFVSDDGDASEWEKNHDKGVDMFLDELNKIKRLDILK